MQRISFLEVLEDSFKVELPKGRRCSLVHSTGKQDPKGEQKLPTRPPLLLCSLVHRTGKKDAKGKQQLRLVVYLVRSLFSGRHLSGKKFRGQPPPFSFRLPRFFSFLCCVGPACRRIGRGNATNAFKYSLVVSSRSRRSPKACPCVILQLRQPMCMVADLNNRPYLGRGVVLLARP